MKKIRQAEPGDADDLAGLLRELGWFEHMGHETQDETRGHIHDHILELNADPNATLLVAEVEGRAVGYASVHWRPYIFMRTLEGYLAELFIHGDHRDKGLGSLLLAEVEREGRERGAERLMLISSRNREAYERHFYEKHGWVEREGVANFVFIM